MLEAAGLAVAVTEVLAIEVRDQPGGLVELLRVFADAGINVEYMYAFTARLGDSAVMVFSFDDLDAAIFALARAESTRSAPSHSTTGSAKCRGRPEHFVRLKSALQWERVRVRALGGKSCLATTRFTAALTPCPSPSGRGEHVVIRGASLMSDAQLPERLNAAEALVDANVAKAGPKNGPPQRRSGHQLSPVGRGGQPLRPRAAGVWACGWKQRVAILMPDSPELVYAFFGAIKIGAVAMPMNTLLSSKDYEYLLERQPCPRAGRACRPAGSHRPDPRPPAATWTT